jgi:hypothetical protein
MDSFSKSEGKVLTFALEDVKIVKSITLWSDQCQPNKNQANLIEKKIFDG